VSMHLEACESVGVRMYRGFNMESARLHNDNSLSGAHGSLPRGPAKASQKKKLQGQVL
jgi:hypothetical protein